MARATLKSIAAEAGVSPMVVSAVARGDFSRIRVGTETRARIEGLIARRGYRPHAVARSLVTSRTRTIALFVPSMRIFEVPFRQKLLIRLQEALAEAGYGIVIQSYGTAGRGCGPLGEVMADAGLFFYFGGGNDRALAEIRQPGFPLLIFGRHPDPALPTIHLDNRGAMHALTGRVLAAGHRRLLLVDAYRGDLFNQDGRAGIADAVAAADADLEILDGLRLDFDAYYAGNLVDLGLRVAESVLARARRPDALLFHSDTLALAALRAFQDRGLDIPRDLAIAANGCDDYCALLRPALDRASPDPAQAAQVCAGALLAHLGGGPLVGRTLPLVVEAGGTLVPST